MPSDDRDERGVGKSSPPARNSLPSFKPSGALERGGREVEYGSRGKRKRSEDGNQFSVRKRQTHDDTEGSPPPRQRDRLPVGRKRSRTPPRKRSPPDSHRSQPGDHRRERRRSPLEREERLRREPASEDRHRWGGRREREHESERGGRKDFVKREPPPGGWDKPSWEPSGALKKEPGEEDTKGMGPSEEEKEKPSFVPSGKLAKDTNTFKGVLIKYNEPPEAKIPKLRWRMYPFKGEQDMPVIYVHRQSAYLVGRDRKIADFPVDHPSCSKQHAALQYRSLPYERPDGSKGRRTRPYIIDLGSGNGTYLNGSRIEPQRYYELKEKDVLRFGFSTREYVMLHEQSLEDGGETDTSEEEDDVGNVIDREGAEERLAAAEEDDLF